MLSSFLTDAVVVVIVLGIMVFVHEAGHFLAAKGFGVRVLTFSLGFGKRLFGFERGGTDYRVSILPLGGYVKMAGDDPTAVLTGDPSEFLSRPRWQRFVIVLMGPMMNFVLAVVVLTGLYMFHFQKPAYEDQPVVIGAVDGNSAAAQAGLQPGDRIIQFDGIKDPKWQDIKFKVLTGADHPIPLTVERDGEILHMSLTPHVDGQDGSGVAGWYPYVPLVIDKVEADQPAGKAGLKPGDTIVGLDGKPIYYWALVVQALRDGKGKPVDLAVVRDGKEFKVHVTPEFTDVMGLKTWRIGIAQISGEAYRRGFADLLLFVAFISLQLGIVNLLPIPVMDGGHIFMLAIEGLMRRDLSLAVKERVIQVGVVLIVLLFVFVMYNDIMKSLRPS